MTKRLREPVRLHVLFALSGAAGLGYQMVWVRMFAAGLGHETPAMLGVASAFLGGLAMGGWCFDRRIGRATNPARWYGGIEIAIGVFGLLTAFTIPHVNQLALHLAGTTPPAFKQWLVVFLLPCMTLLPATAAMGATLPAMERFLAPLSQTGRCVGALYAANTFGAVLGTVGTVFLVMPALGFRASLFALASVNLVCGVAAWALFGNREQITAAAGSGKSIRKQAAPVPSPRNGSISSRRLAVTLFCTGLLGIGFEIVVVRVLSQVLENTIYTYASALAVYLVGTAVGAAAYQRWGSAQGDAPRLGRLLAGLSAACLGSIAMLSFARSVYALFRDALGDSLAAAAFSEGMVAAVVFLVPTALMGATFSHLVQTARRDDGGVGRAGAINTLGCAAAGLAGVLLLPALGTKLTALILGAGYLLLIPTWRRLGWLLAAVPVAFGAALMVDLRIVDKPAGAEIVAYEDGAMASVAVVKTADGHRSLRVNNRLQMGGTAAALAERRQAHLPLLLHPGPRRALFLGPGTGITLGAAGGHPQLIADGVELVPEVVALMRHFEPENEGPLPKRGGSLLAADARRFVRTTTNRYDVIVADLFHPAHDGAGFLYTREHFQAVRERLAPGGLFCQWLPLHQLEEPVLRSIVRTFLDTFSETRAFLLHFNVDIPALALVGTMDRPASGASAFEQRLDAPELRSRLRGAGLDRFINLAGCFVAAPETLRRFAGDAALSTDNHPVVLFAAPRFSIRRESRPETLLMSMLEACPVDLERIAGSGLASGDGKFAGELVAFIAARNVYLKGLVAEGAGDLNGAIEAYLESAARSLQFTPGYARCVTIIQVMAQTDRDRARELFLKLEAAQPAQPLGRKLLGPLFEPAAEK